MPYGYNALNQSPTEQFMGMSQANPMEQFIKPPAAQQPQEQGMDKMAMMKALADALRGQGGPTGQQSAPASAPVVQSAGYLGQNMDTKAIGGALGSLFKK